MNNRIVESTTSILINDLKPPLANNKRPREELADDDQQQLIAKKPRKTKTHSNEKSHKITHDNNYQQLTEEQRKKQRATKSQEARASMKHLVDDLATAIKLSSEQIILLMDSNKELASTNALLVQEVMALKNLNNNHSIEIIALRQMVATLNTTINSLLLPPSGFSNALCNSSPLTDLSDNEKAECGISFPSNQFIQDEDEIETNDDILNDPQTYLSFLQNVSTKPAYTSTFFRNPTPMNDKTGYIDNLTLDDVELNDTDLNNWPYL